MPAATSPGTANRSFSSPDSSAGVRIDPSDPLLHRRRDAAAGRTGASGVEYSGGGGGVRARARPAPAAARERRCRRVGGGVASGTVSPRSGGSTAGAAWRAAESRRRA